jgi:hypothetical protein
MEEIFDFAKISLTSNTIFGKEFDESIVMKTEGITVITKYTKDNIYVALQIKARECSDIYEIFEYQSHIIAKLNGELKFVEYNQDSKRDIFEHYEDYCELLKGKITDGVIRQRFVF